MPNMQKQPGDNILGFVLMLILFLIIAFAIPAYNQLIAISTP